MVTIVNRAPVKWLTRQQPVVAKSTCEAEYIAAAEANTLTMWLNNLIHEIRLPTTKPTLHVDNTAAVQMAKSMGATKGRKCIDVRYHYLHDTVQNRKLQITRTPSSEQYADICTKPLKVTMFKKHKEHIKICAPSPRLGGNVVPSRTTHRRSRTAHVNINTVVPSRVSKTEHSNRTD